jgi:hypothetical protein
MADVLLPPAFLVLVQGGGARAPDHKMFMSRVALDGSADLSGFPEEMSPLESVDASAFESTKPSGVESADEDGSLALESSCSSPVSLPDCGADSWCVARSGVLPLSSRILVGRLPNSGWRLTESPVTLTGWPARRPASPRLLPVA